VKGQDLHIHQDLEEASRKHPVVLLLIQVASLTI
jgi:hypothetical protein